MSSIYLSRPVDARSSIPWSRFLSAATLRSLPEAFQHFSLHPRAPLPDGPTWAGVEASFFPRIDFYHAPTREGVAQALEAYAALGEKIGQWAACSCRVQFAADPKERWDFDHHVSLAWWRGALAEPALCYFDFGRHRWDHTDAPAQADFWNAWAQRWQMPVSFLVADGFLTMEIQRSEAVAKVAQRLSSLAAPQKMESGFYGPAENPPLATWLEAYREILDTRSRELRTVCTALWYYDLPVGMTRDQAVRRLLAEALPHLTGTIWNAWTFDGFLTTFQGLETLQAYSGPDDQQRIELGKLSVQKGGRAKRFLLIEKVGIRLGIESEQTLDEAALAELDGDSGFTFYRSPARLRRAPTTYTLYKTQYLPPEEATDDPGPEPPFDLQKWTKTFLKEKHVAVRGRSPKKTGSERRGSAPAA